jgi:hypothetical protein
MINIVAEGHLDLYRKLDHVTTFEKEKERMALQIEYINMEMRKVKTAVGIA